jgi:hypothetical protein
MLAGTDTYTWLVFWIVVGARFLIPLTIPRYPLPGILASLVLDAADQTIFQQFPGIRLEGYQGYDKALDIYYLTVAYLSTFCNWQNHFAFQVSRFLFYWRLIGVVLFELTQLRALLLIFPNTFEYFFIFYEAYRLRWDPKRMTRKLVIGAAIFIWVVVKLPQEYWIHIAQTDTTDWIKISIFHGSADTSWLLIFQTWSGICIGGMIVLALLLVAAIWLVKRRLPPPDWALSFSTDAHRAAFTTAEVRAAIANEARQIVDAALFEKIILISLVSLIFAQVLPGVQASDLQLAIGVALVVLINTVLSHWIARQGFGWAFSMGQFIVLAVANFIVLQGYTFLQSMLAHPVRLINSLFFVLLISLLVTLFDRYRQIYLLCNEADGL